MTVTFKGYGRHGLTARRGENFEKRAVYDPWCLACNPPPERPTLAATRALLARIFKWKGLRARHVDGQESLW
jgi:hypothetical protein